MDILTVNAFISLIPLIVAACMMAFILFSHINYLVLKNKTLKIIAAIAGAAFAYLYFTTMYRLNVTFGFYISDLHYVLILAVTLIVLMSGLIRRRLAINLSSITGAILFLTGGFLLLA
jgi:hypothetical protein